MEKQKSLFSNALMYGLYVGLAFIIIFLLYYIFDVNIFKPAFGIVNLLVTMAVFIIGMVIAVKAYRDKYNGNVISFGQAFLSGLIMGIVAYLINALFSYLFFAYIEPGMLEQYIDKFAEMMSGQGLPEDQLNAILDRMESRMTPLKQLSSGLISGAVISLIVSLIVAAAVKKENYQE